MAVVGDAYIVVRALTNRVRPEIERAFQGLDPIGERAGKDVSDAFARGINRGGGGGGAGALFGKKFEGDLERARVKLRGLTQAGFFAGPALAGLAGALGSVGAGLVTVGALAGAAAQGGIAVLGSAVGGLIQSMLTLRLALGGVGAALQAGLKLQKGSTANTRAQEAAEKALARARLNLTRILEDYPREQAEIIERTKDAIRDAADAELSSARSTRAYNEAQRRTKKALEDLNKAREEAKEKIQQLRFELEGGAISEKKARLEFEKARDALQRVQDLPPNSRARREAELAFAEADLNLRKAIDRNKDLKKEEAAATKAGVEGSQEVVAAKESLRQAAQAEADAGVDAARARQDAARAAKEAEQAKADLASGRAFRDLNRQVSDARQAVRDAEADLAQTNAGGAAADAFADAMKNLSPEAQKFVRFLIGIRGELDKLKAAAGRDLFPRLETAIQNLVDNLFPRLAPLLQGTGKVLGDIAIDLSNVITKGENLTLLEKVWKNNDELIGKLGKVVGNLYEGALNLLDAAEPLIDAFGDWAVNVSKAWNESVTLGNKTGELDAKFVRIRDLLSGVGKAAGDFWRGLKDIFAVIIEEGGAADVLVDYLQKAAKGFKDFTSAGREDGSLKEFFRAATENFTKVLSLLGNIVAELLKLGDNKGVGQFVDSLNRATDTFGRIGEKLTGENGPTAGLGLFIEKFALLAEKLTETGSIEMFFKVLNTALDVLNTIFGNSVVQKIFAFIAPIIGIAKGLGLVLRTGKFVGKALLGTFTMAFGGIKKAIGFVKDPFGSLRAGSGLTRKELEKQMIVDRQKKAAMKGIYLSADQAARGLNSTTTASTRARGAMAKSSAAAKIKAGALRGLGAAGRIAGAGLRAVGRGFALLGGPIGLIFLVLPLIIENWDKIVAFFKDLIPKIAGFFTDMWKNVTSFFTNTFLPGMGNFFKTALDIITWILFPLPKLIIKFWPEIVNFFTNTVFPWFTALPGRVLELAGKIWDFISTGIRNAWNAVTGYVTGTLIPWLTGLPQRFIDGAGKIWNFVSSGIRTAWDSVTGYVTKTLIPYLTGLPGRFINGAGKIWNFVSTGIQNAWKGVTDFFTNTIFKFIQGLPAQVTRLGKNIWDGLKSGLQGVVNFIRNAMNGIIDFINKGIDGANSINPFGKIPRIPRIPPIQLAEGGIVPAVRGGTMALIGEAGRPERVEPLDPDGLSQRDKAMIRFLSGGNGGGTTINVYPSQGMDERELANLVSRQLAFQMRRGAA